MWWRISMIWWYWSEGSQGSVMSQIICIAFYVWKNTFIRTWGFRTGMVLWIEPRNQRTASAGATRALQSFPHMPLIYSYSATIKVFILNKPHCAVFCTMSQDEVPRELRTFPTNYTTYKPSFTKNWIFQPVSVRWYSRTVRYYNTVFRNSLGDSKRKYWQS